LYRIAVVDIARWASPGLAPLGIALIYNDK
jgi:hypothetical protein